MKIAALILAAGASERFGEKDKLVAQIDGIPLVNRVVESMRRAGIENILAVVARADNEVAGVLDDAGVTTAVNPNAARGMGTSICTGVTALAGIADGILIVPGDMPALSPELIRRIAAAFEASRGEAIITPCLADGAQRNPVLWPKRFFAELLGLDGDAGAKSVLARLSHEIKTVIVPDPAEVCDIDTVKDLADYNARSR